MAAAKQAVQDQVKIQPGYSINWSGQYEYLERAKQRLATVIPVTLAIIVLLLFMNFKSQPQVLIILGTLSTALGGIWLPYPLDYNLSEAVGVGFIALAGVAVEIGVVKLVYLQMALDQQQAIAAQQGRPLNREALSQDVINGALQRLRPITMTIATLPAGLLPLMLGSGTGSEIMQRIAAPMAGGIVSATELTLAVIRATLLLWQERRLNM